MKHDTTPALPAPAQTLSELTGLAESLGQRTVDISGFLHDLQGQSQQQTRALTDIRTQTDSIAQDTRTAFDASERLLGTATSTIDDIRTSTDLLSQSGQAAQTMALWVNGVDSDAGRVDEMLQAVRLSNLEISDIASQVSILAINAKIEAARAGAAGKGFAIVSEAVNDLSRKTAQAADKVSLAISQLADWMATLSTGARQNAQGAAFILSSGTQTDAALTQIETQMESVQTDSRALRDICQRTQEALGILAPATVSAEQSVTRVSEGVELATERCDHLIDTSEAILQHSVSLGGNGSDGPMITLAQDIAGQMAQAFETALEEGDVTEDEMFDTGYRPIPGTDPEQVLTAFTALTDRLLPAIQEPVLKLDDRIVFCAAVDRNGYLPTHNLKFGQPQGSDPVWNAANSRNRRIFDDRVGLKAGRNEKPFLLQVYRRDMGGGTFAMMKDLSVPIRLRGRHWGAVRLAYRF